MEKVLKHQLTNVEYENTNKGEVKQVLFKVMKLSKKEISRLKWQGKIVCNNQILHVNQHIQVGDELILHFFDHKQIETAKDLKDDINILYEDEDVVVVYKKAKQPVHPVHGHLHDSLGSCLQRHYQRQNKQFTIRAIGRLDLEVSGCMLYAKNQVSAARLNQQQVEGTFKKTYVALVEGKIDCKHGRINLPIAKIEGTKRRIIQKDGKYAVTHFDVLDTYQYEDQTISYVQINLETGRTHQIRVHFHGMNHPLVGDTLYGKQSMIDQVGLHCKKMEFISPFTNKKVTVQAPLPSKFQMIREV